MMTSIFPALRSASICRIWALVVSRETPSTRIQSVLVGYEKVRRCWWQSTVVGQRTATCCPEATAAKEALKATSVSQTPHRRKAIDPSEQRTRDL